MRRKGLIGAGVEAHPTISTKKERASHGFVGYDVHPNREGRGRRAIVVELDVILACWFVLSSCRDLNPLQVLGVVDRMQDASAAHKATIWSKAS